SSVYWPEAVLAGFQSVTAGPVRTSKPFCIVVMVTFGTSSGSAALVLASTRVCQPSGACAATGPATSSTRATEASRRIMGPLLTGLADGQHTAVRGGGHERGIGRARAGIRGRGGRSDGAW